jgi:hypothetical protein
LRDAEGDVFSPGSRVPGSADREDAMREMIYYDLGDTDRVVMDYSLGLHGAPAVSTTDIAKRLGLTAGAVSQRKAKIQAMIDEARQMDILGSE